MPIVEAVATLSGQMNPRHGSLAKRVEAAMVEAIKDALAEGVPITNTKVIRERMDAARAAVVAASHPVT